jgi:hypothetical protein
MIEPAPTTRIDPTIARATLIEDAPEGGGVVTLGFANTSYQVHLRTDGPTGVAPGKRVLGRIEARAKRIDKVKTGGRFIEPVYGRPRRVQGRVIGVADGRVVVDAGMPIHCAPTDPRQQASDFSPWRLRQLRRAGRGDVCSAVAAAEREIADSSGVEPDMEAPAWLTLDLCLRAAGGSARPCGAAVVAWALFWDRSRGRLRCPGGWRLAPSVRLRRVASAFPGAMAAGTT